MRNLTRIRRLERCARGAVVGLALGPAAILGVIACGPPPEPDAPLSAPVDRAAPVRFEYPSVNGEPLTSGSLLGRFSVIGLIATYDTASQAQARFLADLRVHHKPRVNVALIALEPLENKPMIEAFASAMNAGFPVAIADAATIEGRGPFTRLHHVPSVVILDREGREVWRRVGLADEATIDAALRDLER